MTNEQLAYIAGFVDGEGTISFHRKSKQNQISETPRVTPWVSIANNDLIVLKWIQSEYGGHVSKGRRRQPQHKVGYQWQLTGIAALYFILDIYLWLKIKTDQAQIVLRYLYEHPLKKIGRKEGYGEDWWIYVNSLKSQLIEMRKVA